MRLDDPLYAQPALAGMIAGPSGRRASQAWIRIHPLADLMVVEREIACDDDVPVPGSRDATRPRATRLSGAAREMLGGWRMADRFLGLQPILDRIAADELALLGDEVSPFGDAAGMHRIGRGCGGGRGGPCAS